MQFDPSTYTDPERLGNEWSKKEILETCEKIKNDVDILTAKELSQKYREFHKTFPKFYELLLQNEQGLYEQLKLQLNIRDEINSGSKSELEANVQLGDLYGKKYVYPITGEPTTKEKKDALRKIISKKN
jgi:hypothetical protein